MRLTTILLLFLSPFLYGFNQVDSIYEAIDKEDYVRADSLLTIWCSIDSCNPDLAAAKFNRYLNESKESIMILSEDVPLESNVLVLKNSEDSTKDSYMALSENWNDELYDKAISIIREAINNNPARLDLRLGFAAALSKRSRYIEMVNVLKEILSYGILIDFKWLWSDGVPLVDPINEMNEAIWDYSNLLFNAEEDQLAFDLCNSVLICFPNLFKFINLCGALMYLENEYDEALIYFSKSLDLSPEDEVIMSNIAQVYFMQGRYDEALTMCDNIISIDQADLEILEFTQSLKRKVQAALSSKETMTSKDN